MKLGHILLPIVALLSCPTLVVGQLSYTKGQSHYQVGENGDEYVVTYVRNSTTGSSRNRNIEDRKRRMEAIDLMGAYQLYLSWSERMGINEEAVDNLFQIFTDAVGYHYDADVYALRREERKDCSVFRCRKSEFIITEADFPVDVDIMSIVRNNYNAQKDSYSAATLYSIAECTSGDYIGMMHDYLSGRAMINPSIRSLQKSGGFERLDNSLYTELDAMFLVELSGAEMQLSLDTTAPYGQFAWIEMVTSAAPADKARYYQLWKKSLHNDATVWEDMLLFAAQNCTTPLPEELPTVSEAIAAFPGAISPYGVRMGSAGRLYAEAEAAYAASNTEEALRLLGESISNEGVNKSALNLIGAVYRYIGEPTRGIPYLILGFMIDPETRFLAGNLVASLEAAGYARIVELARFISSYAKLDQWSKGIVDKVISSQPEELVIQ
ncbi:MAG: hypothetical protein J6R10_00690 [Tidjanibacter sp.]|nr:hypothetical protein [Tidjanibacter sp.]